MIKFQDRLVNTFLNYNLDTLPRSIILIGLKGCGKHSLVNIVADNLKLPSLDISETVDNELIENIYLKPEPMIYIIDIDKINDIGKSVVKKQNCCLKFTEEPLKNTYIFILVSDESLLLNTLKNRCQCFKFDRYTSENLKDIYDYEINDKLLSIIHTPGDIVRFSGYDVDKYINFANRIITRMHDAHIANALSISDKIGFDGNKEKYDLDLLLLCIEDQLLYVMKNNSNINIMNTYNRFNELKNKLRIANINKKHALDVFIIDCWRN